MLGVQEAAGSDDIGVESYDLYAPEDPNARPSQRTLLANVPGLSFRHRDLGLGETWHYWVAAVDRRGNVGPASPVASSTTDATHVLVEAEDRLPLAAGDHTVTFTVQATNAASGGYAMGIDALHLTLQKPAE